MNEKIESALKIIVVVSLIVLITLFFGVLILQGYLLRGESREIKEEKEIAVKEDILI